MRTLALRSRNLGRPGRWLAAAASLLAMLSITMALPVGHQAAASAASQAVALPTCPATTYGYSETRQPYGAAANGQGLDVDEYLPAASGGHTPPPTVPGVILVHGGEWISGNFEGGEGTTDTQGDGLASLAECFAENGFDAFSVDYALTGTFNGKSEQSFPQNLEDINQAIGYVRANVTNLQAGELLILGQSAGANLAELAGENAMGYSDNLLGVISQSGPADLTALGAGCTSPNPCQAGSVGTLVHNYLGCYETSTTCTLEYGDGSTTPVSGTTAYAEASPATSLSATVPAPPYLLIGSSDEIIPVAQDTDMAQVLNAQCVSTHGTTSDELAILPGDQHAATYTDIVSGPELDFLNAVVGGTVPAGCATASPLTGAAMAYDANASAKAIIRFGGCCTTSGTVSGTTEIYNTATGAWSPVNISGGSPPARLGAVLGYDPTSGDLVLFGGEYLPSGSAQPEALNDTWEFSYTASTKTGIWTQVDNGTGCPTACPSAPSARYAAAADEAPHTQGLVLFGGESVVPANDTGAPAGYGDIWLWNGASGTWTQLSPGGSAIPAARYGATLVYDGPNNLNLLFGGNQPASTTFCNSSASCLDPLNDTWKLTYNTTAQTWAWTSAGTAPAGLLARAFAAGASASAGATIFGGLNGSGTGGGVISEQLIGDTWTWSSTAGWTQPCNPCTPAPPASDSAAMAYQRAVNESILYGGYTDTVPPAAPTTTWLWSGTAWLS